MEKLNTRHQNLVIIIILFFLGVSQIFGQTDIHTFQFSGLPVYHWDVVNVNSPNQDQSRIFLYFKTAFDELTFVREDSIYKAKYEISVVIADEDNFQVDGKVWQEEVKARNYEMTNSRKFFSITYEQFDLPPAHYRITIGFTDLETKKTRPDKKKLKLKDFRKGKLAISDIAFVRNLQVDSLGVKSFTPEIADYIVDVSRELHGYFEIYSRIKDENYEISYHIRNAKGKKIFTHNYKRRSDGERTLENFPLSLGDLPQGRYELRLNVKQGNQKSDTKKNFFIRWTDMPSTIYDIDLAIKQIKYIAEKSEWDKLKKADPEEQLETFKKFWKKRDPSPGTPANEWMDDYFNRVAYANAKFSGFRDGWKSDMGMIFIIFGPPSDVERHPFAVDSKPYEIWYYYNINKQFVFMDESGFGEYRLLTRSWEDWRNLIRH